MRGRYRGLSTSVLILTVAALSCARRLETVKPQLYASLPATERQEQAEFLEKKEGKLRVAQGKIAKARTDLKLAHEDVRRAGVEVDLRKKEVSGRKAALRELKKTHAAPYEIAQLKTEVGLAKQHLEFAKQIERYRASLVKNAEKQIEVLEAHEKVLQSEIELAKIKRVHQFTNYNLPQADIQVADFNEQLRRFELDESDAKYRLAKEERRTAKEKHKIHLMKQKYPDVGGLADYETAAKGG